MFFKVLIYIIYNYMYKTAVLLLTLSILLIKHIQQILHILLIISILSTIYSF